DNDAIAAYFRRREIDDTHIEALVDYASGNWLLAREMAVHVNRAGFDAAALSRVAGSVARLYEGDLDAALSRHPDGGESWPRPVMAVCAAAGVGPGLPRPIAAAAAEHLGGPDRDAYMRFDDALDALSTLVVRSMPEDLMGIFHATLV